MTPSTCLSEYLPSETPIHHTKHASCSTHAHAHILRTHTHTHRHTHIAHTHTDTHIHSSSYLAMMSPVVGRRLTSLCKMKLSRSTITGICSTGRSLSGDKSTCNYKNYSVIHGHTARIMMSIKANAQEPLCLLMTTAMPFCRPCWGSCLRPCVMFIYSGCRARPGVA